VTFSVDFSRRHALDTPAVRPPKLVFLWLLLCNLWSIEDSPRVLFCNLQTYSKIGLSVSMDKLAELQLSNRHSGVTNISSYGTIATPPVSPATWRLDKGGAELLKLHGVGKFF